MTDHIQKQVDRILAHSEMARKRLGYMLTPWYRERVQRQVEDIIAHSNRITERMGYANRH